MPNEPNELSISDLQFSDKLSEPEDNDRKVPNTPPIGRPRERDRMLVAAQLFRVMAKGGTLKSACQEVGIRPSAVIRWAATDRSFREAFHRAREQQAHAMVDEALSIADEVVGPKDLAAVARNRLRVDVRKWLASKLVPRLYGTRETLELGGSGVGAAVAVRVVFSAEGRGAVSPLARIASATDEPSTPTDEAVSDEELYSPEGDGTDTLPGPGGGGTTD